MLIKSADDKSKRLALLEDLQKSTLLDSRQKDWLRDELRNLKAGIKGEKAAACYLDGHYKDAQFNVLLHDLRFVVDGEVAQIDHLVINRTGYMVLIETKNYSGDLEVNAHGEFTVRYQEHSPVQIVRYSNRIEVLNPGFSLKDMASLGSPGSRMRNPAIAAVLHEINWAETKGSGVRTMRRLAGDADLPLPEFASDRQRNEFKVTLFLHHLLTEEDYAWLKSVAGDTLTAEEAKALIYARETGVVDNTACRDFSGLDTLQASNLLRRLRDRGLLEKQGGGSRTHYTLTHLETVANRHPEQGELPLEDGKHPAEGGNPEPEGGNRRLPPLPQELAERLPKLGQRISGPLLQTLICDLCAWHALRGEELATLLNKDLKYLRNKHLSVLIQSGKLVFLYPESPNHALQAYRRP